MRCDLGGGVAATLRWVEWGPAEGEPVICVHGLTRTGRDFDVLARALAARGRRVICPDVFGRGMSDWLPAGRLYAIPTYAAAFAALLRAIGRPCDWVGTSMGGLIGMAVGAMPDVAPRRMVLNDIGPFVPAAALRRIGAYISLVPLFDDFTALEAHLRAVHAPFGPLSDAEWRHLAETSGRVTAGGRVALQYDPAIAEPYAAGPIGDVAIWPLWEALRMPVLVIRGAESDLLDAATAERMATRPGTSLFTVPGVGHAPALMAPDQVETVLGFLAG
ncbi:alpha/beta fold hydrolase [Roseomonas sp. CCTCC AB2023176]|uniref:alpha/beta fold hydrolase n=1 Tax=Roseomonas sp. CCTCC AB2023176 TaxID=3342640 RepID=UPI0035E1E39A